MLTEGTGNFLNILAQHLPNNIRTFPASRGEILELGGSEGGRKQVITALVSHPSARFIKGETQGRGEDRSYSSVISNEF